MQQENLGQSTSLWMATVAVPNQNTLGEDTHADVCVVGAGIAGITTAYLLAKEGKSVVVLDDGPIGGGQTQRTTAHLSHALDDRYLEIERLHGSEGAKLAAASHTAAIDRIESIVGDEQIACDFVRLDGYLFVPLGESPELLDRELAAAHRAGLSGVERLSRAPLPFETGPCLRFPRQAQFEPLKYLTAVAGALQRAGGRIFTGTHAETIQGGERARVKTAAGRTVTAEAVVVATNSPVNNLLAMHTKQAAYMTYAIGAIVPRGAVATALYWDTLDPYHYVRIQPLSPEAGLTEPSGSEGQDVLIVGGEDHKTGQAEEQADPYARLEAWTRLRFPMIREVKYRWSGQVLETIDGLAFIGRNPLDARNAFIVTGDSGMGMTHGTIAGILLTDLILGRENPWAKLYDPSRKTLYALGRFLNENLNTAAQYGDWLTGGDVDSPAQIKPGAGAVIRRGLTKMAVYRDEQGALHEHSAVCPHLGGIVHWNDAEKTWDCPCHGSRFDRLGGILNGPANRGLGGVDLPTSNIVKLRCTDVGQGLPLVFLHGFPLSRGVWQKQIEAFRESYRVIAPDLRGFGDSETQPGPATMAQCAADLHALLEQLNTGPMVLIGHSMGGYVALAFARQFPEKLRGLVLVSTKAGPDTAEAAAGRRAMAEKVKAEGAQVVVQAMAPKMLAADNQDAEMVAQVLGFMAPSRSAGVIGALLGMAERPDATAFLTQISVPTLVVTGADDALIPPTESEALAQAIRGAQLKVIPHAGHLVAFEQPGEFNQVLKEWLKRADLGSLNGNHERRGITMQSRSQPPTAGNPVVEPDTQGFLDELAAKGGPQIYELSVEDARGVLIAAQGGQVPKPPADIEDRTIPGGPKGQIAIRIVRPEGSSGALPVVVYFHGGGWVLGDAETHDRLIREIANGARAALVFVDYSRPPEARYPVAIEEAYAATKWVSENGKTLDMDSSRLAVAGDSVGGNMAAVVTLLAKQRGGPKIDFQLLFYPVTDADFDTPSYQQFAEGYFLTREAMKWFWDHYAPDVATRAQATASPLRATIDELRGLPPALVINGECDVLRDEGEAYARKLVQAGVRVTGLRYLGTIHDFVMLNAIADTPAARAAIAQASSALQNAFTK